MIGRVVLIAVVLVGCGEPEAAPPAIAADPAPAPSDHERIRDAARLVLERRCGECHIGSYPTALPRALAVYDLEETEWASRMRDEQLDSMLIRIDEGRGPDAQDLGVTADERTVVHDAVADERARRTLSAGP